MKKITSELRVGNFKDMMVSIKAKPIAEEFPDVYRVDIETYDCLNTGIIANISFSSICKEDIIKLADMIKTVANKMV